MTERTSQEQVDRIRNLIAFALVGAFVGALINFTIFPVPPASKDIITYMVGQLSGMALMVLGYYFTNKAGQDARAERRARDAAYNAGFDAAFNQARAAQAVIDKSASAHEASVAARQASINTEASNAHLKAVDDIAARAAAMQLRHDQAGARGAGRAADQGAARPTAGGACPPAATDGLPWRTALPLMKQAALDLKQLNDVLDWEAEQDALDATERAEQPTGKDTR